MKNDIKYFDVIPVHPLFGCTLPLSYFEDGFITSIQLAEMAGKQHFHMMRDVRRMTSEFSAEDFAVLDMHEDEYEDAQGSVCGRPSAQTRLKRERCSCTGLRL